jgi:uncharacterized protein (DUF1697 family)
MAALRAMAAEDLGLLAPRTLLQSGNLVFGAAAGDGETIAGRLSGAIAARFGVETPVILRSLSDIHAVIAANPFPGAASHHPDRLLVAFLSAAPSAEGVERLRAAARDGEGLEARGSDLFLHYPAGAGASRLTQAVIDRRLGVTGTARNWNTVTALAQLAAELSAGFEADGKAV